MDTIRLMTFAEFEQLPYPEHRRYELRHGEPFEVPPTRIRYFMIRQVIRDLLDRAAAGLAAGLLALDFVLHRSSNIGSLMSCMYPPTG
jgi:hypothetical protein